MYMDDIKLIAIDEKELESLMQTIRIYSKDIGMEFDRENCAMLLMKSEKRQMTEEIEVTIKTNSERSEKRKQSNT